MGKHKTKQVLTDLLVVMSVVGSMLAFGCYTMREISIVWHVDPALTVQEYSNNLEELTLTGY